MYKRLSCSKNYLEIWIKHFRNLSLDGDGFLKTIKNDIYSTFT